MAALDRGGRHDPALQQVGYADVRRDVLHHDRHAHAARDSWGPLPRNHSHGIPVGQVQRRRRGSGRTVLALCGLGVDVHFPDGLLVVDEIVREAVNEVAMRNILMTSLLLLAALAALT